MIFQMIKKDLNLFAVYKNGSAKSNSSKGLVVTLVSFVLVIAVAFGGILLLNIARQNQIKQIESKLSDPKVTEAQNKLTKEANKNQFLISYNSTLTIAKKNFDASRFIDDDLINKISSSMPDSVKAQTIVISPQNVSLTCTCTDQLAPAVFVQALNKKDLFSSISYTGITYEKDKNSYSFTMSCIFKENTK